MNQIINLRYAKKVPFNSVSAAKTTHIQFRLTRKDSADSEREDGFKHAKFLPKLQSNSRDYQNKSINFSTDVKRIVQPDRSANFRTEKRQILNFTKFSFNSEPSEDTSKRCLAITKQGKRPYNEDRFICKVKNYNLFPRKTLFSKRDSYDLYAVFDGHGGYQCAQFLKENFPIILSRSRLIDTQPEEALKETFEKIEEKFLSTCDSKGTLDTSGSCAVVCMVTAQKVYVANLGDSRALMFNHQNLLELTKDHKPHDIAEKMRILKHGGKIYRQQEGVFKQIKLFRQTRILPGNLNVSRTIGDIQIKLKKYGGLPGMISSVPQIITYEKNNYDILLLGSDGLFQAFSNQQIQLLYNKFHKGHPQLCKDKLLSLFLEEIMAQAEARSTDNITIVGVLLN